MIVDLLRNDLSRVCDPNSIRVPQWCDIEKYPYLIHMVSSITGQLLESASITDLIRATFPGGSITGAPKVRAMEIIAELEPTTRGPYCGSMGYIGLNGSMDLNILIRTITASRGWWQLQVGGGIVADSQSDMEEEETWTKAAGLVKAIAACGARK
jgi:para-aminobenzoate synthetase component 1